MNNISSVVITCNSNSAEDESNFTEYEDIGFNLKLFDEIVSNFVSKFPIESIVEKKERFNIKCHFTYQFKDTTYNGSIVNHHFTESLDENNKEIHIKLSQRFPRPKSCSSLRNDHQKNNWNISTEKLKAKGLSTILKVTEELGNCPITITILPQPRRRNPSCKKKKGEIIFWYPTKDNRKKLVITFKHGSPNYPIDPSLKFKVR